MLQMSLNAYIKIDIKEKKIIRILISLANYFFTTGEFFSPVLIDGFSLKFKLQQDSSSLPENVACFIFILSRISKIRR